MKTTRFGSRGLALKGMFVVASLWLGWACSSSSGGSASGTGGQGGGGGAPFTCSGENIIPRYAKPGCPGVAFCGNASGGACGTTVSACGCDGVVLEAYCAGVVNHPFIGYVTQDHAIGSPCTAADLLGTGGSG